MSEALKIAAGAFVGVLVGGLVVQWWKSQGDELRILCDEFCKTGAEAADLATVYWVKVDAAQTDTQEAKLLGLQRRLTNGYRVIVAQVLHVRAHNAVDAALVALFDSMTGGSFKSHARQADALRAQAAQTSTADLILAVRTVFTSEWDLELRCLVSCQA